MWKCPALILLCLGALVCGGCFKADVTVPEVPYSSPPPPTPSGVIPSAVPGDRGDLLRENQQLRQRVAWLQDDIARLQRKQDSLQKDLGKIQADIDKAAVERDRYRRIAEGRS
ncbi:MAG: hypothetical protein LLG01_20015 [Planctomycetaceae bacterium]|nr:hypothetical protein [Planctomycetaceae bacterium]